MFKMLKQICDTRQPATYKALDDRTQWQVQGVPSAPREGGPQLRGETFATAVQCRRAAGIWRLTKPRGIANSLWFAPTVLAEGKAEFG